MIVGMDFGTTNSGMAVFDGRRVQMLPLDMAGDNPVVARTALYVTNDQTVSIGREAINRYFEENVGRPVKMKKVWVGEVEVVGADMYYVSDVYAWIDVLSPGRLFLSIKSGLRDVEYQGTVVGQIYYSLENLIASYLTLARLRAERQLDREIREVVLGRPVRFSTDPAADALAQGRLLDAAFRSGYEKVYLQYEPVAAAYAYAMTVDQPQNILVFDFGGGTLDITVMRIDGKGERQVLATGGIPIAGDIFDQKLVRAKLPKHFGEGSHFGPNDKRLPLPKWIFDVFSNWQRVFELQTLRNRDYLREVASTSDDKKGIEALISMVANNYTLQMFDVVEQTKIRLSEEMAALIRLDGPGYHVMELVTRTAFEQIIRNEILSIDKHLDETVSASGLLPDQIDAVIRTGGSSNIPVFRYMLMDKFGRHKVKAADIFSSVASGLGIMAKGISDGQIEARAYTKADLPPHSGAVQQQKVAAVNLRILQKRMASQEDALHGGPQASRDELVLLHDLGSLLTIPRATEVGDGSRKHPLPQQLSDPGPSGIQILSATSADQLLMVTSLYRFLLTNSDNLTNLFDLGLDIKQFYQLKKDEYVSAIGVWSHIKGREKLLLVTSMGYARLYGLDRLVEAVEAPTPLMFDQNLSGIPLMIAGVDPGCELVLVTDSGRAVRYPLDGFPTHGIQAINRQNGDRIVGAFCGAGEQEMIIVTEDGYGKMMRIDSIPLPSKPNSRGRVTISRKPAAGAATVADQHERQLFAISHKELIAIDPKKLALTTAASTKSYPISELKKAGKIIGLAALER